MSKRWSRGRSGLYIQDALAEFEPDVSAIPSPPAQYRIYRDRLMVNHLIGFGGGGAVAAAVPTSYAFDGTGDHLSIPNHANWDLFSSTGSTSTIECFVKFTDHTGTECIFQHETDGQNKWDLEHIHGSGFRFRIVVSNSTVVTLTGGEVADTNWHFVALAVDSTVFELFLDENRVATVTDSDVGNFGGGLFIADRGEFNAPFDGSLDEIRFSNNTRYSGATLTVPTVEFVSDANTNLLILCNETITSGTTGSGATFVDSGNTGHTVTENGNAIRDASIYKF